MKNLILLAVQGAGKGTLAKALVNKYGYVHISTGDILRERASVGDDLGKEIKEMIDNGIFAPDEIVFEAMEYKITQKECENGYILDGFPRNLEQAKGYEAMLNRLNKDIGIAINMTVDNSILLDRILSRRVCKDCSAIYNVNNEKMRPKVENVCDECGGEVYQRADDNEEAFNKRVKTYFDVTAPIIDLYKEKGILYEVDSSEAEIAIKAVEDILKSLGDNID